MNFTKPESVIIIGVLVLIVAGCDGSRTEPANLEELTVYHLEAHGGADTVAASRTITLAGKYLDSEDALSTWIMECCETKQTHYALVADLYQSWKTWATHGGEIAGSLKSFSQNLAERFERKFQPETKKAGFKGISIREKDMSEEWYNK